MSGLIWRLGSLESKVLRNPRAAQERKIIWTLAGVAFGSATSYGAYHYAKDPDAAIEKASTTYNRYFGSDALKAAIKEQDDLAKRIDQCMVKLGKEVSRQCKDDGKSYSILEHLEAYNDLKTHNWPVFLVALVEENKEDKDEAQGDSILRKNSPSDCWTLAHANMNKERAPPKPAPVLSSRERRALHEKFNQERRHMIHGTNCIYKTCEERCDDLDEPCDLCKALQELHKNCEDSS